jgi:hypothetical protein
MSFRRSFSGDLGRGSSIFDPRETAKPRVRAALIIVAPPSLDLSPSIAQRRATEPLAYSMGRLNVRDEFASPPRRQSFLPDVLPDTLVQAEVRNKLFQLSVFALTLLLAPELANTRNRRTPSSNGRTSAPNSHPPDHLSHGVPVSTCFSANAICSSVYLDFFMFRLPAQRLNRTGKLSLKSA